MRIRLGRALSLVVACSGVLLALGNVALASECHANCDGGYLAMLGLVGGGLALGSSALGAKLGGSTLPKRGPVASDRHSAAPVGAPAPADLSRAQQSADPMTSQRPAVDTDAAIKAGADYAGKLAKEMAPRGEAVQSGLGIVKSVVTSDDPVGGLADGVTDVAQDQLTDTVRSAVKGTSPAPEAMPSPSIGATPKYCRQCGTGTREGARFCGHCGNRFA